MHRIAAVTLMCLSMGLATTAHAWHGGGGHGGGGHGGGGHSGGHGGYGGGHGGYSGGGHYGGYGGGFYGGSSSGFSSSMGHGSSSLGGSSFHSGMSGMSGTTGAGGFQHVHGQGTGAHTNFMGKHFAGSQAGARTTLTGNGLQSAHQGFQHNGGGLSNHVNHPAGYWNRNSYFFGYGSPFFGYFWYPWFGNGYGGGYGGYGGYGYYPWGSYGNGYGYPYDYNYQCDLGYEDAVAQGGGGLPQVPPTVDQLANSVDFAGQGEIDFKAGRYSAAVQNWRHALVDDPRNGAIVLLLSQALFQVGQYDEAAGAAQQAMRMLPQDKWGGVVANYKELYDGANVPDYTNQLKAVEKARDAKPDAPGLRFLLGYHFGFLGYPKQAVKELDKVLELAPKDEVAQKLRDQFKAKLEGTDTTPKPPTPADEKPAEDKSST